MKRGYPILMIRRAIQPRLRHLASAYPVVTLTGPRQAGKTTLCKMAFPGKDYVSLEAMDRRQFAESDPRGFLSQYPAGAILDEIQRVPSLLSYLQEIVDEDPRPGRFILTGSAQFELSHKVSQSLAGRTALLKLLPFTLEEAYREAELPPLDRILWSGFYPRIHHQKLDPSDALAFYVETYVERDVRALLEVRNLAQFERFVQLCAGRTGQLLNLSNLGQDCGITHNTARAWLSVLQASHLVYLLKPQAANLNKRLIRAPKLYFLDVGLAAFLLGIRHPEQTRSHPLRGALFETFVVAELLKHRFNLGLPDDFFFFRDSSGHEVDLILETGGSAYAVEIKAGATVASDGFRNLSFYRTLRRKIAGQALVYGGRERQRRTDGEIFGFDALAALHEQATKALAGRSAPTGRAASRVGPCSASPGRSSPGRSPR